MMKLREFFQRRRRRKSLSNIRESMLLLGMDVSHLSDEEIEQALAMASKSISSMGMPASAFVQGLQNVAGAVQRVDSILGGVDSN